MIGKACTREYERARSGQQSGPRTSRPSTARSSVCAGNQLAAPLSYACAVLPGICSGRHDESLIQILGTGFATYLSWSKTCNVAFALVRAAQKRGATRCRSAESGVSLSVFACGRPNPA